MCIISGRLADRLTVTSDVDDAGKDVEENDEYEEEVAVVDALHSLPELDGYVDVEVLVETRLERHEGRQRGEVVGSDARRRFSLADFPLLTTHQCTVYNIQLYEKLYKIHNFLYELHVIRRCHYYTSYTENHFSVFLRRFCRNGLRKFLKIMKFL